MSHYESFNDPFECRCEVLEGFPKKDPASTRFKSIITAWGFDNPNDHAAIDSYDDYIFSLEDTEPSVFHIIDGARISCFSKANDNLLMWSHYADGLRGFCIEFDHGLVLSNNLGTAQIYEVLYSDMPSVIDTAVLAVLNDQVDYHGDAIYAAQQEMKHLGRNKESEIQFFEDHLKEVFKKNNDIYQKMLATKPKEWSYEEEIRIISQAKKQGMLAEFLKYPPESIKGVIIGEKMPKQQRQALEKVLERHPSLVTLKFAKREKGKFNVVVSERI